VPLELAVTVEAHAAPVRPRSPASRIVARWWVPSSLVVMLAVGGAIRAHGFTNLDLWFDDAWAAAPARVGWSKAIHMVLTAPGYGLALRLWIRLDPATTWFLQLPAFVLSLAAIPAVYALLRWLRSPRWIAIAAALIVTVNPILVQYSTRVKEYPFDLLGACLLLALGEWVRRDPRTRRLVVLAVATVLVLFMSAGGAAVVAGVWAALALSALADPRRRAGFVACAGLVAVGCVAIFAAFFRHLPPVLNFNWRRRGFLFDYRSLPLLERSITLTFGGFLHGALAYPVAPSFFRSKPGVHDWSAAILGILLLCVAVGVPVVHALGSRTVTPALGAALALGFAVLFAAADRVPLGDGRTDEALYPALLVCLAACVQLLVPRVRALVAGRAPRQALVGVLGGALVVGSLTFGIDHPSIYPTISLRTLAAQLRPLVKPGDKVFVDTFNSFGWCYYQLSPCEMKVGGLPPWPQGFRPVSTSATYFIATHYGIPLPELTEAEQGATAIWYVGFEYGTFDVGAGRADWPEPVDTYMLGLLHKGGWHQALPVLGSTVLLGVHCYALLFVKTPTP
jgi:hypothetical protein